MIRSDLITRIAARFPKLQFKDADESVKTIIDGISSTLANNGRVEVRGFGSFQLNLRPSRKGRNPKSGEAVMIPAKYCPHFKSGKELREGVNASHGITPLKAR